MTLVNISDRNVNRKKFRLIIKKNSFFGQRINQEKERKDKLLNSFAYYMVCASFKLDNVLHH